MERDGQAEVEGLARTLGVVLHCLRDTFPDDFYRRCAFSARAIRQLLARDGVESHAVGGRFTALAAGRYDARFALQGFQSGPEPYPHIWVETDHRLIDLGPHLLPFGSPFPLVTMPTLAWNKADPLPAALSYERIEIIDDNAPFSVLDEVSAQAKRFVDCCFDMIAAPSVPYLLTGMASLKDAERRSDPWALAATAFQKSAVRGLS